MELDKSKGAQPLYFQLYEIIKKRKLNKKIIRMAIFYQAKKSLCKNLISAVSQ